MQFELVLARLMALPDPLPAPNEVLMPVVVERAGGRPGQTARPSSADRGTSAGAGDRVAGSLTRAAGVLVLVYPDDDGVARVILTERARRDGHHSGEVSFPGGKAEAEDADIAATALREATEEVALDPAAVGVRILGHLERFRIPVSGFEVTPVIAVATGRPRLTASPSEVARILEPRITRFLPGAPITIVERTVGEWPLRYGAYDVDGLSVWGATARILSQLGAVLIA